MDHWTRSHFLQFVPREPCQWGPTKWPRRAPSQVAIGTYHMKGWQRPDARAAAPDQSYGTSAHSLAVLSLLTRIPTTVVTRGNGGGAWSGRSSAEQRRRLIRLHLPQRRTAWARAHRGHSRDRAGRASGPTWDHGGVTTHPSEGLRDRWSCSSSLYFRARLPASLSWWVCGTGGGAAEWRARQVRSRGHVPDLPHGDHPGPASWSSGPAPHPETRPEHVQTGAQSPKTQQYLRNNQCTAGRNKKNLHAAFATRRSGAAHAESHLDPSPSVRFAAGDGGASIHLTR